MFGYILANRDALSEEQLLRYRGCYCGLCRALKKRYGRLSRMTLNFDMTFLVMMLSSMYEPEETSGEDTCVVHPVHGRGYWQTEFTDYAADINVALGYYKCLDDWKDGRNPISYAEAKALESAYKKAASRIPEKCRAIEKCISTLSELERSRCSDPDAGANCFGELMGELFACRNDNWTERFRAFGEGLGRFIYMMDACADFEKDKKRGNYNPLAAMGRGDLTDVDKKSILKMLIGECTMEFERLPLLQDVDIMRNILYSGVWIQYEQEKKSKVDGENGK